MDTKVLTVSDFLLARIDEDEAVARAAGDGHWTAEASDAGELCEVTGKDMLIYDEGGHTEAQAAHIARHDPARVLAECAAKRRIVELHAPLGPDWDSHADCCSTCPDSHRDSPGGPCPTLRALASVCADHPDFNPEWRA